MNVIKTGIHMNAITLPWVDWGMGAAIIGVFALVCIIMVLVVSNMMRSTPSDETPENE